MKTFVLQLIVTLSDHIDEDDLKEYIEFELGHGGGIDNNNPMIRENNPIDITELTII